MPLKQALLTAARASGLSILARKATGSQLRILAYHGLWVTPGYQFGNRTFISPEQFEARMIRLKQSGLPVLPLGDAVDRLARGSLPEAAVAITIDDGWASTFTHMLPVLEALNLPATLYATTWYSGRELPVVGLAVHYLRAASGRSDIECGAIIAQIEALPVERRLDALRRFGAGLGVDEAWLSLRQFHIMSADELTEASRRGLDIQLHTHRHIDVNRKIDSLALEVTENRDFLRSAIGNYHFAHFCYPSGATHERAAALLAANGVQSATVDQTGLNAPGADCYALRRLLDGRSVSDAEFDAYLSGILHYTDSLRALMTRKPREAGFRVSPAREPELATGRSGRPVRRRQVATR
ncbi:MAG TPA: polysaccharide deacetylase family protein [Allosphingosinicella sp.]|jgi:peptidoglycan/xylan/chitin deacetylase (PgdA/CDA1 family)